MTDIEWEAQALLSLRPLAAWTQRAEGLEWHDTEQTEPTEAEIDAEVARLKAEWDTQEYARNRQAEYPSIQECVHAILDDQLTALQEKRQAVKIKYPRG